MPTATLNILFVTGTDTGIGKTTVSCAVARALVQRGVKVKVFKPCETGCDCTPKGEMLAADGEALRLAAGGMQTPEEVVCYKFSQPVAPVVAARLSNTSIDPQKIIDAAKSNAAECDLLIVEGAGGLLVPITDGYSFAELAKELEASCLIVVGSRLGAVNHSALTFESLSSRKLSVIGYVLNHPYANPEGDIAVETNRGVIKEVAARFNFRELAVFPFLGSSLTPGAGQICAAGAFESAIKPLVSSVFEHFRLK